MLAKKEVLFAGHSIATDHSDLGQRRTSHVRLTLRLAIQNIFPQLVGKRGVNLIRKGNFANLTAEGTFIYRELTGGHPS